MYKALFCLSVTLLLWGCQQIQSPEPSLYISGTIKYPETGLVLLEEYDDKQVVVIDTLEVSFDTLSQADSPNGVWIQGVFNHPVNIDEPGYYRLNFYEKQMVNLILSDSDLKVEVDGNAPRGQALITGSMEMDQLNSVNNLVQEFQQKVGQLNIQFTQANAQGEQEKMTQLREEFEGLDKQHKTLLKNEIRKMGSSLAVLQVIGNLDTEQDFELLDSLGNIFAANPPDTKHTQNFLTYIDQVRAQNKSRVHVQVGKIAPEINLPNPQGEYVALSSLRGKIVLVDFWAQWCRPCRMENPNIVAAYQKYKGQGFEVFGVSLDRTKDKWLQGIEEDGLDWVQVSDLKYWQSAAAKTYGINAIPASFLLDRDGTIIAKNLRGPALHAKLREIMG
ncbi:MAG: AhpC/TSA family protein [Cyclobacteriaceae bacterium]|nr:AhpC/TSA family protein [Cyclobacteriaceae bacterium]